MRNSFVKNRSSYKFNNNNTYEFKLLLCSYDVIENNHIFTTSNYDVKL